MANEVVPVDLTESEEAIESSEAEGASMELVPYDPAEDREKVRGSIAQTLVWLLVGIVALSILSVVFYAAALEPVKGILDLVLAPIVGLVGAVTGFYFGEKARG